MPADPFLLRCRERTVCFPRRPLIMGIVNINDDSFSGDGTLDPDQALETAATMVRQGADIIDVGAESARTNRAAISTGEEVRRLLPFVRAFPAAMRAVAGWDVEQLLPPLLSINTWRPVVAEAVLPVGGDILNDMGGLPDAANARICARHRAALLIMHTVGEPKVAHLDTWWDDPMAALEKFFDAGIARAIDAGLPADQILIDPGIDFAKQRDANLRILAELPRLTRYRRPLLVPVSRKTVIGEVLGIADPRQRDAGTVACLATAYMRGANVFRVHNVAAAAQAVKILESLMPPAFL